MVCTTNCIAIAIKSEILSQNHAATPTRVGGVKGFAAKTLSFCIKEHYHYQGLSKKFTSNSGICTVHGHEPVIPLHIPLQSLQLHMESFDIFYDFTCLLTVALI